MTQTPQEWLEEFFLKPNRPSERADRSALYKYRTSETEFAALKRVLKTHSGHRLWNKLFVLYAAEWWRQNFKGGYWAWKPIFDSLNIEKPAFNQQTMMIKEGLKSWGREVYKVNDQHRYLATIVIEGGLPIQTVANDNSWLSRLLCRSFSLYLGPGQRNPNRLYSFIEYQAEVDLPKSLQKEGVYLLLEEMVTKLVELKEEHHLGDVQSPVETLDVQKPNWREDFPLPINSDVERSFIDTLLRDFVETTPAPLIKHPFQARRALKQTPEGWLLCAEIELPKTALTDSLGLSENDRANLPSRMQISLETSLGMKKRFAHAYKTSQQGQSILKFSGELLSLSGKDATAEMKFCLYNKEKLICDLSMTQGEALEDDLPWVFTPSGEEWDYVGQASQKVSADTALVVVKDDLRSSDGTLEPIGTVLGDRIIYKICGEATFENGEGKFRVHTSATDMNREEYVLDGTRAYFPSSPSSVYLGKPRLSLRDTQTHFSRRARGGKLEVKAKGGNAQWQSLNDTHHGVVSLRFKDSDGYIVFRKHIAILPTDFNLSLRADGTTPTCGDIIIENAGGFHAHIADKTINATITESEEQIKIALHSADAMPPERVRLHLGNIRGEDITFTLPFPANGVRAFDANNQLLSKQNMLFLNHLHGIRLHLFNGQGGNDRYQIQMNLHDDSLSSTSDICFDESGACGKKPLEIAFINYLDKVRELLSISNSLDAYVSVDISLVRGNTITLNIYQYAATMEKSGQSGCVSLERVKASLTDLEKTNVFASLVSKPDQPIMLDPLTSAGVHRASWTFLSKVQDEGHWIIHPDKSSVFQFRPLHWSLGNSSVAEDVNSLQQASAIRDDKVRTATLKRLITAMVADFTHPSWCYIDALWQNMNHLPLPTFDIWKAFANNPRGLVALLCKGGEDLLNRMSQEFPIMWELIPMDIWQEVFCCYYENITKDCPVDIRYLLIDKEIQPKLDYIEAVLGMGNLAQTLACLTGVDAQNQTVFPAQIVQGILKTQYQGGDGYSGLLNRRRDDTVPPYLRKDIEKRFFALPTKLSTLIPDIKPEQDAKKSVIYLPIILADESVRGNKKPYDPIHIFKMKILRAFDLDWFYFVFNMTQQYWHHHQHLERKK